MSRILWLAAVLLLCGGGVVAAEPPVTHTEESFILEPGTYTLGDYSVELFDGETGLQIKEDQGRGHFVHATWGFDEIHERMGETHNFTDSFYIRINDVFYAEGQRRYDVTLWHEEDVFARTDVSIDIPDYVQLRPGSQSLTMEIENNGLVNETYYIEEELPDGISASYSYDGYNVSRVAVDAGETQSVSLTVDIDESVPPGDYELVFRAMDRSSDSVRVPFELLGEEQESDMSFDLSSTFSRVETGNNVTFDVQFFNTGETGLENASVQIDEPENWRTWVSLEERSMEPDERVRGTMTIYVPNGVSPGDEFVDVAGSVNGIDPVESEIRIAVINRGEEGLVGIGLALGSILVLVLVYKLFGRR